MGDWGGCHASLCMNVRGTSKSSGTEFTNQASRRDGVLGISRILAEEVEEGGNEIEGETLDFMAHTHTYCSHYCIDRLLSGCFGAVYRMTGGQLTNLLVEVYGYCPTSDSGLLSRARCNTQDQNRVSSYPGLK